MPLGFIGKRENSFLSLPASKDLTVFKYIGAYKIALLRAPGAALGFGGNVGPSGLSRAPSPRFFHPGGRLQGKMSISRLQTEVFS